MTPGGKAIIYAYSPRIWLTRPKAKSIFRYRRKGYRVGNTVKVKLEKSRFGSQGRQCQFKILWGDEVGVADEESWFDAIQGSEHLNVLALGMNLSLPMAQVKSFSQLVGYLNLEMTSLKPVFLRSWTKRLL